MGLNPTLSFRFPNGTRYVVGKPQIPEAGVMRPAIPEVGDRLRADGQEWVVVRVATGNHGSSITVTLRPLTGAPETAA